MAKVAAWGLAWPEALCRVRSFLQPLSVALLRFRCLAWQSCSSGEMSE